MDKTIHKGVNFFSRQGIAKKLDATLGNMQQLEDVRTYSIKQIRRNSNRQTMISIAALALAVVAVSGAFHPFDTNSNSISSKYLVEYLTADEKSTWKSWRLAQDASLSVTIIDPYGIGDEKMDVIIDAISSQKVVKDSSQSGTPYAYLGWSGALERAQNFETKYNIPTRFDIVKSNAEEGDIIITLSNLKDDDGYTGYTRSLVAGNEILKSYITIYDVNNLSDKQLSTIVKHEFGHALGLGHSSDPSNLMHDTIKSDNSFITSCNIEALVATYNGFADFDGC